MNIKKFENFEIVNRVFSDPNKDENKYKLYGEYIINNFFKDDEFASDVKTLKANKYNI